MDMRLEQSAHGVPAQQLRGWSAYCEAARMLESEHSAEVRDPDTHDEHIEGGRADEG